MPWAVFHRTYLSITSQTIHLELSFYHQTYFDQLRSKKLNKKAIRCINYVNDLNLDAQHYQPFLSNVQMSFKARIRAT